MSLLLITSVVLSVCSVCNSSFGGENDATKHVSGPAHVDKQRAERHVEDEDVRLPDGGQEHPPAVRRQLGPPRPSEWPSSSSSSKNSSFTVDKIWQLAKATAFRDDAGKSECSQAYGQGLLDSIRAEQYRVVVVPAPPGRSSTSWSSSAAGPPPPSLVCHHRKRASQVRFGCEGRGLTFRSTTTGRKKTAAVVTVPRGWDLLDHKNRSREGSRRANVVRVNETALALVLLTNAADLAGVTLSKRAEGFFFPREEEREAERILVSPPRNRRAPAVKQRRGLKQSWNRVALGPKDHQRLNPSATSDTGAAAPPHAGGGPPLCLRARRKYVLVQKPWDFINPYEWLGDWVNLVETLLVFDYPVAETELFLVVDEEKKATYFRSVGRAAPGAVVAEGAEDHHQRKKGPQRKFLRAWELLFGRENIFVGTAEELFGKTGECVFERFATVCTQ